MKAIDYGEPWSVFGSLSDAVKDRTNNRCVATCPVDPKIPNYAARIALCVNTHESLLAACRAALQALESGMADITAGSTVRSQLRAAISAAEEA